MPLAFRYFRLLNIYIFILYYYMFLRFFWALAQPVFVGSRPRAGSRRKQLAGRPHLAISGY